MRTGSFIVLTGLELYKWKSPFVSTLLYALPRSKDAMASRRSVFVNRKPSSRLRTESCSRTSKGDNFSIPFLFSKAPQRSCRDELMCRAPSSLRVCDLPEAASFDVLFSISEYLQPLHAPPHPLQHFPFFIFLTIQDTAAEKARMITIISKISAVFILSLLLSQYSSADSLRTDTDIFFTELSRNAPVFLLQAQF